MSLSPSSRNGLEVDEPDNTANKWLHNRQFRVYEDEDEIFCTGRQLYESRTGKIRMEREVIGRKLHIKGFIYRRLRIAKTRINCTDDLCEVANVKKKQ